MKLLAFMNLGLKIRSRNDKENIKDCDYCKCLDKKDYRQMLHCYIWFGGYLKIKEQSNGK